MTSYKMFATKVGQVRQMVTWLSKYSYTKLEIRANERGKVRKSSTEDLLCKYYCSGRLTVITYSKYLYT